MEISQQNRIDVSINVFITTQFSQLSNKRLITDNHVVEYFMELEQGSPEWWAIRMGLVTGSVCSPLMASTTKGWDGLSSGAWTLVYSLAEQLIMGDLWEHDDFSTYHMDRGTELEPQARRAYELQQFCRVEEIGFCRVAGRMAGCSPDFRVIKKPKGGEIKCLMLKNHIAYVENKKADLTHTRQVEWCLWVTGWKQWDFVHYHPNAGKYSLVVDTLVPTPSIQDTITEKFAIAEKAICALRLTYAS